MKRVPVILQMTPSECGAACLAMVLTHYGREATINECRKYLHTGRDGLTARAIAQAARELGMRVRAFSLEPAGLAQVQVPTIIHWNFDHFLVLEHWSPKAVRVVDPAIGRRRLSAEDFSAGFTGVVLTLEPGANFRRQRAPDKYIVAQLPERSPPGAGSKRFACADTRRICTAPDTRPRVSLIHPGVG